MRWLVGIVVVVGVCCSQARAVDSTENAALQYYRAWLHMDFKWLNAQLVDVGIGTVADPQWRPSENLLALGQRNENNTALCEIIEATKLDECDFGTPRDQGPETLLPHLGYVRDCGRWIALAARVELDRDRHERAIKLLTAGYRLAHHLSKDEVIISSLSAVHLFETIDGVATLAVERGLEPQLVGQLAEALSIFDARDPFRIARAVAREGSSLEVWIQREFEETMGTGILEVLKAIRGLNETEASFTRREQAIWSVAAQIAQGTELREERAQLQEAYARAQMALLMKNSEQGQLVLADLSADVIEGEHGPLAQVVFPSLDRSLDSLHRSRNSLCEARKRVALN